MSSIGKRFKAHQVSPAEAAFASAFPPGAGDALLPAARPITFGTAVALLLVSLSAVILSLRPITDSDFWHHLAFGRMLLDQGEFPRVDLLGSTSNGRPWVSSGWLPATLLYGLYKTAPQWGAHLYVVAIVFLQGVMLLGFAMRRGLAPAFAATVTIAALGACFIRFLPRPDLFSQLMLSGLLLLLLWIRSRPGDGAHRPLPLLLLIPLVFVAWANLHMLFPIGLFIVGLFAFTEIMQAPKADRRRAVAQYGLILGLCAAACLVSPNGLRAVWFIWENARLHNPGQRINELSPLWTVFGHPGGGATLVPLAVWMAGAVVWVGAGKVWRHASAWHVLTIGFLLLLALVQRRQVALAVPGITLLLLDLWPASSQKASSSGRRSGRRAASGFLFWQRSYAFAVPAGLLIFVWGFLVRETLLPHPFRGPVRQMAGVNCDWYPCEAVEFLRQYPPPQRLFQDLYAGSFLAYQLWPDTRVFMDGRLEVYNNGTYDDFFGPPEGRLGVLELFEKYQVRSALVDWRSAHEQPLSVAAVLSDAPGWRLCWFSDHYALFVREDAGGGDGEGENASSRAYAAEHGYQFLNPLRPEAFMRALENPAQAEDARKDARRARAEDPDGHLAGKAAEVAGLR